MKYLIAQLAVFSGSAFATINISTEFKGSEFDGDWTWSGNPIKGQCSFSKVNVVISGSSIQGKMVWPSRRGPAESNLYGVIHEDKTIDMKLKRSLGDGKTSIGKGRIEMDELFISEKEGRCHYDLFLKKAE